MKTEQTHDYALNLIWEGNRDKGTVDYKTYSRQFRALINNKADIIGTADTAFRGDPDKHNPEELLISVASCHMLSYLALCARSGVTVTKYEDEAQGHMTVFSTGGGRFKEIILYPCVTIKDGNDDALALKLHEKAHELCFIANSCNFSIRHEATILAE